MGGVPLGPPRRLPGTALNERPRLSPERRRAASRAALHGDQDRRRPTLPGSCPPSTIGAEGLNGSVRNGKRCFPLAMATENRRDQAPARLENCTQAKGEGKK